jgi:hypothetical protein
MPSKTSTAGYREKQNALLQSKWGTGSSVTDYVAADGSNNIAITADVSDLATLEGMLASPPPDVLAAMQEHGVVPPITAYVER